MKKLFVNDKVLFVMPWIYLVSIIAYEVISYINWNKEDLFFDIALEAMNLIFVFGIVISYKKHEKNIMKMLFGGVLTEAVIYAINCVKYEFIIGDETVSKVCSIIYLLLYVLFFFNHLFLGYGHKSSPKKVEFNRLVGLLILLTDLVWNVLLCCSDGGLMFVVETIVSLIAEIAIITITLCVETKVDAYKIEREIINN